MTRGRRGRSATAEPSTREALDSTAHADGLAGPADLPVLGEVAYAVWTADGRLRTCLFGDHEVPLRDALRAGAPLAPLFRQALAEKPRAHDLHEHLATVEMPFNLLGERELCPGAAALDRINAGLR